MKFALYLPIAGEFADVRLLAALGREAELAGWDACFLWDGVALALGRQRVFEHVDAWIALTAIALQTETIRIGPMVTPAARRHPAKLARETVSLDQLSGGRLTLGVGLGMASEFEPFGEDPDARVRAAKLDETLTELELFWSGRQFTFEGVHRRAVDIGFLPRPVQTPRIPIWVGGSWPGAGPATRAARFDGMFPVHPRWPKEVLTPADYRSIAAFIGSKRPAGARPFDLALVTTMNGEDPPRTREVIDEYTDAGVTWWIQQVGSRDHASRVLSQGPPSVAP